MASDSGPRSDLGSPEISNPGTPLAYRSSAGSTISTGTADSGYGSMSGADDSAETDSQPPQDNKPTSETHPTQPPKPQIQQRMFDGSFVFDPSPSQVRRYNEILSQITQPLNNYLENKKKLLSRKPKRNRVDAVRLVVMGPDSLADNAKPYIVFFCSRDVEKSIKEVLEKAAYQDPLHRHASSRQAFGYKIVPSGISLKWLTLTYSAEVPEADDFNLNSNIWTNCGTPIRLYKNHLGGRRRATLGGILKLTDGRGKPEYYAMTAGHPLDGWEEVDTDDESIDSDVEKGTADLREEQEREDHQVEPLAVPDETGPTVTVWDFPKSRKCHDLITPSYPTPPYNFSPDVTRYFDWALFKLQNWKLNALVDDDDSVDSSNLITLPDFGTDMKPAAVGLVGIMSASQGIIMGTVQSGMAKIAIEPGNEVVDAYIVSLLLGDCEISNGDSGSWVVSLNDNQLLGHVVASDVLGDVYVIPIMATLSDIQTRLLVSSISLPSDKDVAGIAKVEKAQPMAAPSRIPWSRPIVATKSVEALVGSAQSLYRQAIESVPESHDVIAGVSRLSKALKHLLVEVEDPDSPLNAVHQGYGRQLATIVDECSETIEDLQAIIAKYEANKTKAVSNPTGDHKLLAQGTMVEICRKLSTQKVNIDIFLDTVQLHHYNKPETSLVSIPDTSQLDKIKDKVDSVAIRLFLQQKLKAGTSRESEETKWEQFCEELVKEGFSEDVLHKNKDVLRAYIRELDLNGWLDRTTAPSLRGFLPQRTPATGSHVRPSSRSSLGSSRSSISSIPSELSYSSFGSRSSYTSYSSSGSTDHTRYRSQYTTFISTRDLMASDSASLSQVMKSMPLSGTPHNVLSKILPDANGREIPLDATWTKIGRRLVSPEILEQAKVRYEARPTFVAILGVLSKAKIIEWARLSTETRHSRSSTSKFTNKTALAELPSTSHGARDTYDSDLEVWDSDLEAWDPWVSDGSESGEELWDDLVDAQSNPSFSQPIYPREVPATEDNDRHPPRVNLLPFLDHTNTPKSPRPPPKSRPRMVRFDDTPVYEEEPGDIPPRRISHVVRFDDISVDEDESGDIPPKRRSRKVQFDDTPVDVDEPGDMPRNYRSETKNRVHAPETDRNRDRDRDRERVRFTPSVPVTVINRDRDTERGRYHRRHGDGATGAAPPKLQVGRAEAAADDLKRERVAQKKYALGETLGAVGIGSAAATLLSVLAEAAQNL